VLIRAPLNPGIQFIKQVGTKLMGIFEIQGLTTSRTRLNLTTMKPNQDVDHVIPSAYHRGPLPDWTTSSSTRGSTSKKNMDRYFSLGMLNQEKNLLKL
jgi:hypothetical protein